MKIKETSIAKTIWWKMMKVVVCTLLGIRTYHKPTVIKTIFYLWKYRHKLQRCLTEGSEIDKKVYGQLIFANILKKTFQWRKDFFNKYVVLFKNPHAEKKREERRTLTNNTLYHV